MKYIKASEFKAKCLQLMDDVAASGEPIVITKIGKPTSELVPYQNKPDTLFGLDAGTMDCKDDLIEPVDEDWNAVQ